MAAPTVASTSTLTVTSSGSSQTITAPSGIATGDFLVIIVGLFGFNGATTPTSTGFTSFAFHGTTTDVDNSFAVLTKTAVLADESATDYTINAGAASEVGPAVMFRITGSPNEIQFSNTNGGGISRPNDQLLIMVGMYGDGSAFSDIGGYTITSSDSNPTWTELIDDDFKNASNTDFFTLGVAYATTTDTSEITAYSLTGEDVSGLYAICTQKDETGSNVLLTASPTTFSEASVEVGTTGSNALLATSPTIPAPTTTGTSPTTWTSPTKPNTTWTKKTL